MSLLSTDHGHATRALHATPERVWLALVADPTTDERARRGIEAYERASPETAHFEQGGRGVDAKLDVMVEGRRLRTTIEPDEGAWEVVTYTLRPEAGGTRLDVDLTRADELPRWRIRARLDAAMDDVEKRARGLIL
jgi:hypothetical protein